MSVFGSLYIGVSGLQTSQNALNTTAHNMSNIDTVGYTRQQVQQGTRIYKTLSTSATAISYQQTGLGVNYTQVKQIRDDFLDKAYRRESGRSAFYEVSTSAFDEVYNLFQELEGEAFADSISNLWKSVEDLARDPGNAVGQGVFVKRCSEFVTRSQAVYKGLKEYQDNLNLQVKKQVDTINAYGKRIAELNAEIQKIEGGMVEKANDLRDERNLLIDELSSIANIECRTNADGNIIIKFEGKDFVKSDSANEICLYTDLNTGFYTPYWKHLAKPNADGKVDAEGIKGAELFNLSQPISTSMNTDIGSLKSILMVRGDHRATYHDLTNVNDKYDKEISQSIMMNVQAEFDQLIHAITTGINKIFEDAANKATAANPDSTYMRDSNGNPYQIFNTISGNGDFTVENIIINGELKQAPSLLGFKKDDDTIDQETADLLKDLFKEESLTLNPNVKTKLDFVNYYDNLISQVATSGNVSQEILTNQQMTVDNIAAAREQIVGTSSDEEMSNMIMFQNAYNASSRYINVISEMMEHIISTLGR